MEKNVFYVYKKLLPYKEFKSVCRKIKQTIDEGQVNYLGKSTYLILFYLNGVTLECNMPMLYQLIKANGIQFIFNIIEYIKNNFLNVNYCIIYNENYILFRMINHKEGYYYDDVKKINFFT